jgi:hypothetical protein
MTNRTTTFRRRFGAASLLVAAVLFGVAEPLFPTAGDDPAAELAANAQHHGQLLAAIFCYLAASVLFIPAFFALMNPVRGRGTVLTHLGAGLALLGNALAGLALSGLQFVEYEASSPGVDRASLVPFIQHSFHDAVLAPLPMGHYLFALGIVLLAIGLFRSRAGYRWAAICLGLAPLVDMVVGSVTGGLAVDVLTDGLLVAGAAGYAWWQVTTTDAAWQGVAEVASTGGRTQHVSVTA